MSEILFEDKNVNNVMLPCETKDFTNFISSLLGKPQTIERFISSTFEINRNNLLDIYYLIDQRINQQNESSLVQFIVKISYSDNSRVTLNSVDDFTHYNEINSKEVESIQLSWIYLIKFKTKDYPEKQEINLTFQADSYDRGEDYFTIRRANLISIRIHHTERTWGVDIESLLKSTVEQYIVEKNKTEKFLKKNREKISTIFSSLFFFIVISNVWLKYVQYRENILKSILNDNKTIEDLGMISTKIDYVLKYLVGSSDSNLTFILLMIFICTFTLTILISLLILKFCNIKNYSFILITDKTSTNRIKYLKNKKKQKIYFVLTIITSIITGVFANIIFKLFFENHLI